MKTPRFTDTDRRPQRYDRAPTVLPQFHRERIVQQAQQEERERTEAAIRVVQRLGNGAS